MRNPNRFVYSLRRIPSIDWDRNRGDMLHKVGSRSYVALLVLMGSVLRAYHLGFKSLWLDEAVIYHISKGGSLSQVIRLNARHNSAPPLYPLLIKVISQLADTEVALRMLSFVAGSLAIVAIYFAGRKYRDSNAGLVAALLMATSVSQIRYSQQLREYSLAVLFSVLILIAFHHLVFSPAARNLLLAASITVLGVLVQYGLALLLFSSILVHSLVALMNRNSKGQRLNAFLIFVAFFLSVIAVYYVSLRYHLQSGGFASGSYLQSAYWQGGSVFSAMRFIYENSLDFISFSHGADKIVLFLAIAGAIWLMKSRRGRLELLLLGLPFLITIQLAFARLYPFHGGRQDIFLSPSLYLMAAVAGSQLMKLKAGRDLVISLFIVILFFGLIARPVGAIWHLRSTTPEHSRPVVSNLKRNFEENDAVLSNWLGGYALRYYLRVQHEIGENVIEYLPSNADAAMRTVRDYEEAGRRGWVFLSHCNGWCTEFRDALEADEGFILYSSDNGVWLYLYGN